MANEPAKKAAAPAKSPEQQTPINPGVLQQGESTTAPLTTRVPRGVNEPEAGLIADEPAAAALQKHVQEVIDKEEAQGYRGDPSKNRTPNEAYTLRGVGRGDPTPETVVYTPTSK